MIRIIMDFQSQNYAGLDGAGRERADKIGRFRLSQLDKWVERELGRARGVEGVINVIGEALKG